MGPPCPMKGAGRRKESDGIARSTASSASTPSLRLTKTRHDQGRREPPPQASPPCSSSACPYTHVSSFSITPTLVLQIDNAQKYSLVVVRPCLCCSLLELCRNNDSHCFKKLLIRVPLFRRYIPEMMYI